MKTPEKLTEFYTSLKKMSPQDFIYPGTISVIAIAMTIVFLLSTRYIMKNINIALTPSGNSETFTLNLNDYNFVAQRLSIAAQKEEGAENPSQGNTASLPAPKKQSLESIDKKTLSLSILNSTTQKGVAGTLAQTLESLGYAKATTGNEKSAYAKTTIFLKDELSALAPSLLEEIKKTYPEAVASTTPNTAANDIQIVIGAK